ncbi:MAG: DUF6057 family protein [Prevotella sp.]|nr:DUF6057 family protein [Prevotella sp.]
MVMAICLAIIIFCFWNFLYPYAVVGQERLFVWDEEFWQEYGFFQYVRDFFTQFFHYAWIGALLLALGCSVIQLLTWGLLSRFKKYEPYLFIVSFIPSVCVWYFMFVKFDVNSEELSYDFLQRRGLWEQIIKKGQESCPQSLACQYVIRMARHQTGRISDGEMFADLALTNNAMNSRTSAYLMSDIYMYSGLVNLSQRASFEAMASIEDFSMSGRALQRLTETALITGQYRVAEKYISILEKTIYYRDFAKRMRQMVESPALIDSHPVYGSLKKAYVNTKDVLFN